MEEASCEDPAVAGETAHGRLVTLDVHSVKRAAVAARRAAKAGDALEGDPLALWLLLAAVQQGEREIAALREADEGKHALDPTLTIDGIEFFSLEELLDEDGPARHRS
jgi:hypothetical protein